MNVIHRDLNPSNVFLCFKSKDKNKIDERSVKIKIIDFNVSKKCIKNEQEENKEQKMKLRLSSSRIGTPIYKPPEFCRIG